MKRRLMDLPQGTAKMNVYVGNLELSVTELDLKRIFSVFGQVVDLNIMNDKYIGSGQPRRYAYVKMAVRSQGEAAIAGLNGKSLRNRIIGVIEALPLSPASGTVPSGNKYRRRS